MEPVSGHGIATDGEAEIGRLRSRELLLVVAFWALLALVTVANRLFDPRSPGPQLTLGSAPVALAIVESVVWAALTPPIFALAARFEPERGHRVLRVLLLVAVGIVVAVLVRGALDLAREWAFEPPVRPGRGGGGRRPPFERFWFLNELIIYFGVLAAGIARAYSRRYRARREQASVLQAQLAEARLEALRRQLDPHFLFNTLHAISSLVERDPRGVRRMIARLSELLRHSIEGPSTPEIPLRDEVALLQRYLDIMQVRFQGRLETTMAIDAGTEDALVPNLILQPLVENAIRHGVDRVHGTGRLTIAARREGSALVVTVRDNGPGPGAPDERRGEGVGLRNSRARLEQLYGADQRLELRAAGGGGAEVELRLPWHRLPVTEELPAPARTVAS